LVGVPNGDAVQLAIKDCLKNNIRPSCLGLFDIIHELREGKDIIDASELGYMVNRRNQAFDEGNIQKIAGTYRELKLKGGAIMTDGVCLIENVGDYSEFAVRCLAF
jgi:hypothetical protein